MRKKYTPQERVCSGSRHVAPMLSMEEKRIAILNKIKFYPKIVDLKLSCYMAACNAISKDAPLLPSPQDYIRRRHFKEALDEINENIPNISLLRFYLEKPDVFQLNNDTLSVLYWLLVKLHEPYLILIKNPEDPMLDFDYDCAINEVTGEVMRKPDFTLKFSYRPMSMVNVRWKANSQNKATRHGYTPVRLQDLHSVIHRGPKGLKDKGCLGYGLTLCSELGYAIERAETSWVWGKSSLASQMYAVLVVEFVDTSNAVLRLARRYPVYYLISDTEFARIRYLLLWITAPPAKLPKMGRCATADISLHQRIVFSMILVLTYILLPRRPPLLFQRGFEGTLSVIRDRFFKHNK